MAFVKIASTADLPPGSLMQAEIGESTYAVCNVDGEIHALWGTCPHAEGPLGEGTLQGTMVVCPWHGYEFDCRTGANDMEPDLKVARYAVKVDGGDILLDPDQVL